MAEEKGFQAKAWIVRKMADLSVTEKLANLGYLGLKLEADKGTPLQPDTFVPLYSEDMAINVHLDEDNPIVGLREARYQSFLGQEDYKGTIKVLAEPKTFPHFLNMLLKKGVTQGDVATGYTHPFTLGDSVKSYTIEFLKGNIPFRFYGVEAVSIAPAFEDNKMVSDIALSALGCFSTVKVKSASTTTVVLEDGPRPSPTKGLTTDDTLRLYDVSEGTYEDVTISAVDADGKTLTVSTISGTFIEGDLAWLVPLSESYSIVDPFSWGRTEFRFGADAATALSATQTRIEKGSNWKLLHNLEDDEGAKRSGSFRPAALVRTQGDVEITLKKFFADGQEQNRFLQHLSHSLVVRHYSSAHAGTDLTEAELRMTVNEYNIKENTVPLSSGDILYNNLVLSPIYKSGETQMFDVKIVNSLAGSEYE